LIPTGEMSDFIVTLMLTDDAIKDSLRQKAANLSKNILSLVHVPKQDYKPKIPVQIVTASKSLQMQANQEFQRTLLILNGTLMVNSQ
jgi:hypothetical protein